MSKWHRNCDSAGNINLTLSAGGAGFLLRQRFDMSHTMFRMNEICEKTDTIFHLKSEINLEKFNEVCLTYRLFFM